MTVGILRPLVIYIDIDDTLIRSFGTKRIPMLEVIQQVRQLKEKGANLYAWSSGGAEYARESIKELGIEDCFLAFLPKPNVLIDDQQISGWHSFCQVHPAEVNGKSYEEYVNTVFGKR